MPVIVVGADTRAGQAILEGLHHPAREVRAFVTDEAVGAELKERGFKVALGDVSDDSHVEAAALHCFCAVLITEAARDGRDRAFAGSPRQVLEGWARAVAGSKVSRVIWVSEEVPPPIRIGEVASVDPADPDLVEKVVALDSAQSIL